MYGTSMFSKICYICIMNILDTIKFNTFSSNVIVRLVLNSLFCYVPRKM